MKGKTLIFVQGHLDKMWEDRFEAIGISYEGMNTVITVDIKDEAHLHGVLNIVRDLNLKLISVNPAE